METDDGTTVDDDGESPKKSNLCTLSAEEMAIMLQQTGYGSINEWRKVNAMSNTTSSTGTRKSNRMKTRKATGK